jgi:hypothetical protein
MVNSVHLKITIPCLIGVIIAGKMNYYKAHLFGTPLLTKKRERTG